MQIIASAPQPAGYLAIIQHNVPSRRRRCACPARHRAFVLPRKQRVVQQLAVTRRFIRQPLMEVFGLLVVAGAAKSGHGGWAIGGILTLVPIYFGAAVTFMATRSLAAWVGRVRLYEEAKV